MKREGGGTLKNKRVPESRHKPGLGYCTGDTPHPVPMETRKKKEHVGAC